MPVTRVDVAKLKSGGAFLDALSFPADAPMRLLVVEKSDLSKQRWFELPPGYVFHFGNAWDDGASTLRFDYVHHTDARVLMESLPALMRGEMGALASRPAASTQVAVDLLSGRVSTEQRGDIVEFPRIDPRRVALRNRHIWHSTGVGNGLGTLMLNGVLRYDLDGGQRDVYRYESEALVEEHVFVPDPASTREGAGWLVGCAYDVAKGRTSLNVLDAARLADGPIARAWLPYALPPGFHGHFDAA
jgi:carotenoid cleavage dioxygenase